MLPHGNVNLIDLDLINKMGIALCNIKVTRMSLLGHDVRAVGRIKQTIQCVHKGQVQGTIHLQAKVVRNLYSILGVDCMPAPRPTSGWLVRSPPTLLTRSVTMRITRRMSPTLTTPSLTTPMLTSLLRMMTSMKMTMMTAILLPKKMR